MQSRGVAVSSHLAIILLAASGWSSTTQCRNGGSSGQAQGPEDDEKLPIEPHLGEPLPHQLANRGGEKGKTSQKKRRKNAVKVNKKIGPEPRAERRAHHDTPGGGTKPKLTIHFKRGQRRRGTGNCHTLN